jgi:hypothetical protein
VRFPVAAAGRRVKQLYVLGALEVEDHKDARGGDPSATLDGLLEDDQLDDDKARVIENCWRGAEGYHFFLLAQRQVCLLGGAEEGGSEGGACGSMPLRLL